MKRSSFAALSMVLVMTLSGCSGLPSGNTSSKKDKEKQEAYTDLIYSQDLKNNYSGEYISRFIHDSNPALGGFAGLFSNPEEYKKK